jgi:hypothetical protein
LLVVQLQHLLSKRPARQLCIASPSSLPHLRLLRLLLLLSQLRVLQQLTECC